MRRLLLAGVALTILCDAAAVAADAPRARPRPEFTPVHMPFFAWNGVYAGLFAGYGFGHSRWADSTGMTTGDFRVGGATAGVALGYNMQFNTLVLGIEADLGWSGIKGSSNNAVCGTACETANTWLGTARGRIGYAFDRFLPFVSGGAAFGNVKISDGGGSASATRTGYALGGGLEYGFAGNWTARVDYHYVDLGKASCGAGCAAGTPFEVRFDTHLVRGGVNYRF